MIASGSLLAEMAIASTSALGATSISIFGLANIGGTLMAGWALWWVGIGAFSAPIHLPIRESRTAAVPA